MNSTKMIQLAAVSLVAVAISAGGAYASISFGGGNGTTGPNSENENMVDFSDNTEICIENTSSALNDYALDVSAGDSFYGQNTAIGDIIGGDVLGDVEILNDLNTGDVDLGMAFDDFGISHIDLGNSITGPESLNRNEVNISQNRDIAINNNSEILNDLALNLATGNNRVSHNTVVGDVVTGDVRFDAEISNIANGGMGSIELGNLGMDTINADFENHLTGPNSENTNVLNIENDSNIAISNNSTIDNNVALDVNTGGNTVGHNTCVGDVVTGDIGIGIGIRNIAN